MELQAQTPFLFSPTQQLERSNAQAHLYYFGRLCFGGICYLVVLRNYKTVLNKRLSYDIPLCIRVHVYVYIVCEVYV